MLRKLQLALWRFVYCRRTHTYDPFDPRCLYCGSRRPTAAGWWAA